MSTSAVRRQEDGAQEEKTEMDSGEKDIYDILSKQFQPKQLQVQDVSGEFIFLFVPGDFFRRAKNCALASKRMMLTGTRQADVVPFTRLQFKPRPSRVSLRSKRTVLSTKH